MLLVLPAMALTAQTIADGPAYRGDMRLTIAMPGAHRHIQNGDATVRLEPRGDERADFIVQGTTTDDGSRADLTVKGRYRDGGWHSEPRDLPLSIDPDGRIEGGGNDPVKQLRFQLTGRAFADRLRLRNEVTVDSAQSGVPAGTVLTYEYNVRRAAAAGAATHGRQDDGTGCQMRMVPIAGFGGSMTMGMVPDCDPD